jgi:predicted Rossmann fold nucleotide-binding protein DprA/Smf involved in DNA uptake
MNQQALSADTEVVLLLCGRFGGERQELFQPLSTSDYGELAKWLNGRGLRPGDLMTEAGKAQLQEVHEAKLERKRVDFLLGRGTAMALAMERWSRGGLWVISRGDAEYPKRLRRQLKKMAPPLLYGAGKKELLEMGGLAIIGSRDATEPALEFAREVAAQCAQEGVGVVSGGARGVDAAAMQGSSEAGGCTIGVLANDLLKTSVNRQNRLGLQEGRLVLVSPFYPEAGFNGGNAMARNKYIYALSDRALVIDSALGSGGTWAGALEDLRYQWVPLYVRSSSDGAGNAALLKRGGVAFDFSPNGGEKLSAFFERTTPASDKVDAAESTQASLLSYGDGFELSKPVICRDDVDAQVTEAPEPASFPKQIEQLNTTVVPVHGVKNMELGSEDGGDDVNLDMFGDFLSKLEFALVSEPLAEEQVSEQLGIEKGQAKVWLKKAVESGRVEKLKRPVRYARGSQASLLG